MHNLINTFWIVISAILFAAFVCGVVVLVVFAYLMVQQDKRKKQLQFKGMSHAELAATTRVLLARDARRPKRARYKGRFSVC